MSSGNNLVSFMGFDFQFGWECPLRAPATNFPQGCKFLMWMEANNRKDLVKPMREF